MAENNEEDVLDDFFAKKDKSKKKSKSSKAALTPADLLSGAGETKKKKKKTKAEKAQAKEEAEEKKKEDEEWKEQGDDEVDYSDLKIQSMSIRQAQQEAEEQREKEEKLEQENRESKEGGAWNVGSQQSDESAPVPTASSQPAPYKPPVASSGGSSYVPPHLRSVQPSSVSGARKKKKEAPNIQSDVDFPTLGGQAQPPPAWGRQQEAGFEEVKSTGSQQKRNTQQPTAVQIGNRYDSLAEQ